MIQLLPQQNCFMINNPNDLKIIELLLKEPILGLVDTDEWAKILCGIANNIAPGKSTTHCLPITYAS